MQMGCSQTKAQTEILMVYTYSDNRQNISHGPCGYVVSRETVLKILWLTEWTSEAYKNQI